MIEDHHSSCGTFKLFCSFYFKLERYLNNFGFISSNSFKINFYQFVNTFQEFCGNNSIFWMSHAEDAANTNNEANSNVGGV